MNFITALKAGNTLANPGIWKRLQVFINIATLWLPAITLIFPPAQKLLDKDVQNALIQSVALINAYLTTATTEKVGL